MQQYNRNLGILFDEWLQVRRGRPGQFDIIIAKSSVKLDGLEVTWSCFGDEFGKTMNDIFIQPFMIQSSKRPRPGKTPPRMNALEYSIRFVMISLLGNGEASAVTNGRLETDDNRVLYIPGNSLFQVHHK